MVSYHQAAITAVVQLVTNHDIMRPGTIVATTTACVIPHYEVSQAVYRPACAVGAVHNMDVYA